MDKFTNIEDLEMAVCNGSRIGHCIAVSETEDAHVFVVWGTAPAPIGMPTYQWVAEWLPINHCHPVMTGDHCDHCAQARQVL